MLTPFAYVSGGAIHFASFIYFINDLWEWKKKVLSNFHEKKTNKQTNKKKTLKL